MRVHLLDGLHAVTVVAPDRLGLFADTAGLLAAHGLTVRSALVRTVDGVAVDTWWVDSPYGEPPPAATLLLGLRPAGGGGRPCWTGWSGATRPHGAGQPAPHVAAQIAGDARAVLVTGASERATVAEVRAPDRPGLLHALGRALAALGVDVRSPTWPPTPGRRSTRCTWPSSAGRPCRRGRVGAALAALLEACEARERGGGARPALARRR